MVGTLQRPSHRSPGLCFLFTCSWNKDIKNYKLEFKAEVKGDEVRHQVALKSGVTFL